MLIYYAIRLHTISGRILMDYPEYFATCTALYVNKFPLWEQCSKIVVHTMV